jgi:hypothetical protein
VPPLASLPTRPARHTSSHLPRNRTRWRRTVHRAIPCSQPTVADCAVPCRPHCSHSACAAVYSSDKEVAACSALTASRADEIVNFTMLGAANEATCALSTILVAR